MSVIPWLCWIAPFVGFAITPLIGRRLGKIGNYIEPVFALISALCATTMIANVIILGNLIHEEIPWIESLGIGFGVLLDPLSIIMANVVSWIGFLIMVYSIKYMEEDVSISRFWALMNLFIGGMLLLVLADNFIQMFIGWEIVGVASYSLIGYYYRDEREYWIESYPPSHCSMKAFVITKIGDLLMLAGMLLIFLYSGTFSFIELAENLNWVGRLAKVGLLLPTLFLLLCGPLGKSAQFPFHEWLPEAMAGPTPVSALIHAATMVKAGVYFVARILPILHYAAWELGYSDVMNFFYVVAFVGAFTTFLAGSQAIVAKELKKILAYSTISQIGYMMLGLGVAGLIRNYILGLSAVVFHLISHALFKALLFLSAGAVIHATETRYVSDMGGLRKYMPITFYCMVIGAMALAGIPPLSGFWSKDAILLSTAISGRPILLILGLVTAGVTVFYSLRMIGLIFFGRESEHIRWLEAEGHHIHEAHYIMWLPYAIMATLTIIIGAIGPFLEEKLHEVLSINVLSYTHFIMESSNVRPIITPMHEIGLPWHIIVPLFSIIMIAIGGAPSYMIYIARKIDPELVVGRSSLLRAIYKFLIMRWYINPVYYIVFVNGLISFSRSAYKYIEISILEQFNAIFVNFFKRLSDAFFDYVELSIFEKFNISLARLFKVFSRILRRVQTGVLSYNIVEMVIGMLLLILIAMLFILGGA